MNKYICNKEIENHNYELDLMTNNNEYLKPYSTTNFIAASILSDRIEGFDTFIVVNRFKDKRGNEVVDLCSIADPFWNKYIKIKDIYSEGEVNDNFDVGSLYHIYYFRGKENIVPTIFNTTSKLRYTNIIKYADMYIQLSGDVKTWDHLCEVSCGGLTAAQALLNFCKEIQLTSEENQKDLDRKVNNLRTEIENDRYGDDNWLGIAKGIVDINQNIAEGFRYEQIIEKPKPQSSNLNTEMQM